jgi:hypothetical protein
MPPRGNIFEVLKTAWNQYRLLHTVDFFSTMDNVGSHVQCRFWLVFTFNHHVINGVQCSMTIPSVQRAFCSIATFAQLVPLFNYRYNFVHLPWRRVDPDLNMSDQGVL